MLIVSAARQMMYLFIDKHFVYKYVISTAKNGIGCLEGSECTPYGAHKIVSKIGYDADLDSIFKGRIRNQPMCCNITESSVEITTRILRLCGCEKNLNLGQKVDSFDRYIYIHGINDENAIGMPISHGCINMKKIDMFELFSVVSIGCLVFILKD